MLEVRCSACGKPYRVPRRFAGRTARCKICGARLPIAAPGEESTPIPLLEPDAEQEPETDSPPVETKPVQPPDSPAPCRRCRDRFSSSAADWVFLVGALVSMPMLAAFQWYDSFPAWRWTGWFLLCASGASLLMFLVGAAVRVMRPAGYACVAALGLYGATFFTTYLNANAVHIAFYGLPVWAVLRFFTSLLALVMGLGYLVRQRRWLALVVGLSISLTFSTVLYIIALVAPRAVW